MLAAASVAGCRIEPEYIAAPHYAMLSYIEYWLRHYAETATSRHTDAIVTYATPRHCQPYAAIAALRHEGIAATLRLAAASRHGDYATGYAERHVSCQRLTG